MQSATRRAFLGNIGQGMLLAGLGPTLARDLRAMFAPVRTNRRVFACDDLEALVTLMQGTAPEDLQPQLVAMLKAGTPLPRLVTAGALANVRAFGGTDYEGYHAFMALLPALAMSQQMPQGLAALPVLKVLWRNTARIQKQQRGQSSLPPIEATEATAGAAAGEPAQQLREFVRARDLANAERLLARRCSESADAANADLQALVQDDLNVHRIVLAWRAWDMLRIAGTEQAVPLLRQFVRFCADEEAGRIARKLPTPAVREDVPRILEKHHLGLLPAIRRKATDDFVDSLSTTVFGESRAGAAEAVAAALADGYEPDAIGEAISLAANRLLLHDTGKNRVHGASVGVHASDAANAWRHVASVAAPAVQMASLVVAAYHTAGQSANVGKEPWSYAEQLDKLETKEPEVLLAAAAAAIEQKDQRGACAAIHRYGEAGHAAEPAFQLLLRYAVSEDGALHAEKYFHTVRDEFDRTRAAFRWRRVVALARVTASEFGEPAPGVATARQLLAT